MRRSVIHMRHVWCQPAFRGRDLIKQNGIHARRYMLALSHRSVEWLAVLPTARPPKCFLWGVVRIFIIAASTSPSTCFSCLMFLHDTKRDLHESNCVAWFRMRTVRIYTFISFEHSLQSMLPTTCHPYGPIKHFIVSHKAAAGDQPAAIVKDLEKQ